MKTAILQCQLVQAIPRNIEGGVIYVSREYGTAVHKCCCGCGSEVVTPLGPTDWQVEIDHEGVTVYPSIGNWSLPCRSHYWIRSGRIQWAEQWSQEHIEYSRRCDKQAKHRLFREGAHSEGCRTLTHPTERPIGKGLWLWIRHLVMRR